MSDSKLTIYTPVISPRVQYSCYLIFNEILGVDHEITNDAEAFKVLNAPKLNYSTESFGDEIFIYSCGLLTEKGIREQTVNSIIHNGNVALFPTSERHHLPFDPFAASFYLASRYEEYLPHKRDQYNRFSAGESIAFKKNFLHVPVVHHYAIALKDLIHSRYPGLVFQEKRYRFVSTIDIDNAWAYLEKGMFRTIGAYGRSLLRFDIDEVRERTRVLMGIQKDPYDTYEHQLELQKKYGFESVYFFLLGEYGTNDRNVPTDSRKLQSLIKSLADYAKAGIHPSFASNEKPVMLRKEIQLLRRILKRDVTNSRQHFLVLKFPDTYRNLIEHDITDDFTMGYAANPGFRAGMCMPFNFYDLDKEEKTELRIHPFTVMDATLRYYLKIDPSQAMEVVKPLIDAVKQVNGEFQCLWHNESLSENRIWKGWKPVYEQIIREAVS